MYQIVMSIYYLQVKILCQQPLLKFLAYTYNLVPSENITRQEKQNRYCQVWPILTRGCSQYRRSRSNSKVWSHHSSKTCSLCHTEQGSCLQNENHICTVTVLKSQLYEKSFHSISSLVNDHCSVYLDFSFYVLRTLKYLQTSKLVFLPCQTQKIFKLLQLKKAEAILRLSCSKRCNWQPEVDDTVKGGINDSTKQLFNSSVSHYNNF